MPSLEEKRRFHAAYAQLQTIAVTGTNGKTTTTSMLASIVLASGQSSARLTTLGAFVNGREIEVGDSSSEFLRTVEAAIEAGTQNFCLEVTSKALMGGWGQKWPAHIAVFTNLSRDHLDMHRSPEAYLAAKAQLFMGAADGAHCILNAADVVSEYIAEVVPAHASVHYYNAPCFEVPSQLQAQRVQYSRDGLVLDLEDSALARDLGGRLLLPIVGEVHADNALAAALAAHWAGFEAEAIVKGLSTFTGVPGRFEVVCKEPLVIVDYAHTPDGLRKTLETARKLMRGSGQLRLVFGCGGERDLGKRAQMGAIAHQRADLVVVTNDNPRRENPQSIAEQIASGAEGPGALWSQVLDREKAIHQTIRGMQAEDVLVIAGKGHEQVQELGRSRIAMCDVQLAKAALKG